MSQILSKPLFSPFFIGAILIFVLVTFFSVVVNINSATSIERDKQRIQRQIQFEQNDLTTNKKMIEDQILEEIKRKNKTSEDERVKQEDIIPIQRLPRAKETGQ